MRLLASALLAAALCLVLVAAPDEAEATGRADTDITIVQFRDLFNARGKPSFRAAVLSGRPVAIQGFLAPPPAEDSPFRVLVGEPTEHCPYCTGVNEAEHLPYILVYPSEGAEIPAARRFIAIGTLDAGHDYEQNYGLHNDLRLREAVLLDAVVLGSRRARPGADRAAQPPAERRATDNVTIDDYDE